jgi:hypothetical protein
LCENKLDFLFCIPNLNENNIYFYDFIIGLKNPDKINAVIKHKFNLIELKNLQYLNQMLFDTKYLENLFKIKNIENNDNDTTIFKDKKFTLFEKNLLNVGEGKDFLFKKYFKISLMKLCFHLYHDRSIDKVCAFTNFFELAGGGVVHPNNNDGVLIRGEPFPLPFVYLIDYNDDVLFFIDNWIEKFH